MGGKLTLAQMRIILIIGAVLLIVLTYFLVFQSNMDQASQYQTDTQTMEKKIVELEGLQSKVTDLEIFTSLYEDEMKGYVKGFPVKLTKQKSVYLLYRMMIQSGVEIQSITAGNQVPFYYKGKALVSSTEQEQAQLEVEKEPISERTVKDSMEEMVGSTNTYKVELSGTANQIYKAMDWITENSEKMSIGDVDIQFDSSTGKLVGNLSVNFYCMLGNGVPYKEPDMSGFTYGVDNVFAAFK